MRRAWIVTLLWLPFAALLVRAFIFVRGEGAFAVADSPAGALIHLFTLILIVVPSGAVVVRAWRRALSR
ncbi:MAG: hypothetical protein JOZ54_03390 [Acidobacteria bacterium]|nr:hypothetical protein [Acidobacteriota bacterium]